MDRPGCRQRGLQPVLETADGKEMPRGHGKPVFIEQRPEGGRILIDAAEPFDLGIAQRRKVPDHVFPGAMVSRRVELIGDIHRKSLR